MALTKNDMEMLSQLLDQKLDQKLQPVYDTLANLEKKVDAVDLRLKKVELTIETDIRPYINEVAASYLSVARDYRVTEKKCNKMQDSVDVLEISVQHHSSDIAILKKACNIPCLA
ncbi:MAG: hypothetical protein LUD18_13370 [Lachnospiraceae bacterium]|nr:hypothetical protein [Lachnospiraceae bacterium]